MTKSILSFLIKITLFFNLHFIYAYLIYYTNKNHLNKKNTTILVFQRVNSDMDHLTAIKEFNFINLTSKLQYTIASLFLDKKICSQKDYFVFTEEKYIKQKEKFKNEIYKVLKHLKRIANIKYMIVANSNYYEHQEWANAGKLLDIQLVVYSKESVMPKGRVNAFNENFTNLSTDVKNIHKILVYGKSGYEQYKNTKLVTNDNIHQVGSLKTDHLFNKIKNISENKRKNEITMFAFPCDQFPENFDPNSLHSQVWQGGYWAPNLWKDCIDLFYEIANQNPDLNFVVKTKSQESTDSIKNKIQTGELENIIFTHSKPTWEIYRDSKLILGFNSTVLVEMLTTDVPILIPKWYEAVDKNLEDKMILNSKSDAYNTLNSRKDMIESVTNIILHNKKTKINSSQSSRDEIIKEYIYKVDGLVGKRIVAALR